MSRCFSQNPEPSRNGSPVAQLVERLTVNQLVVGSSPTRGANSIYRLSDIGRVGTQLPDDSCIKAAIGNQLHLATHSNFLTDLEIEP